MFPVFGVVEPEDSLVGHHKAAGDKIKETSNQSPTAKGLCYVLRFILFRNQEMTDYKTLKLE